jgi:hypothetical protein
MTLFDVLFIALFLAAVATVGTALVFATQGQAGRSMRLLLRLLAAVAIYLAIVAIAAMMTPRRIVHLGEARCFDDWCITVENAARRANQYSITLQLSSSAKRVSQREKGLRVYLTDDRGRRFDPNPDAEAIPFDIVLGPGQTVESERSFTLPDDAHAVGLVAAHDAPLCFPGCYIIGESGHPLGKEPLVPLP